MVWGAERKGWVGLGGRYRQRMAKMVSLKAVAMLHAGLPRTTSACTLTLLLTAENSIMAHACFYTQHLWVRPTKKPGF